MASEASKELDALVASIHPQWRKDFQHFIETGDATDDFLAHIDSDRECQGAIERAFQVKMAGFEALANALSQHEASGIAQPLVSADEVSSSVVAAFERAARLPKQQKRDVFDRLRQTIAPAVRNDLATLLKD